MDRLSDLIDQSGGHGVKMERGPMIIYVDCVHCSFTTVWQPDETVRTIANRWNQAHGRLR